MAARRATETSERRGTRRITTGGEHRRSRHGTRRITTGREAELTKTQRRSRLGTRCITMGREAELTKTEPHRVRLFHHLRTHELPLTLSLSRRGGRGDPRRRAVLVHSPDEFLLA